MHHRRRGDREVPVPWSADGAVVVSVRVRSTGAQLLGHARVDLSVGPGCRTRELTGSVEPGGDVHPLAVEDRRVVRVGVDAG